MSLKKISNNHNQIDFITFQSSPIIVAYNHYIEDLTNNYFKGRLEGHLFENYVNNLVLNLVQQKKYIKWFCPPLQGLNDNSKTLNRVQYVRGGNIEILRDQLSYAEYDSLLGIDDYIVILEMKHTTSSNIDPVKLTARLTKLMVPYDKKCIMILVIPSSTNLTNNFENQELVKVCKVENFDEYFKKFNFKEFHRVKKENVPKFGDLSKLFPGEINFDRYINKIKGQFYNKKLNSKNFWNNCLETKFITRIPIGILSDDFDLSTYDSTEKILAKYQLNGYRMVVYLRFHNNSIILELFLCTKQEVTSKNAKKYQIIRIRFTKTESGYLIKRKNIHRLTFFSYFYWEAINFSKTKNQKIINDDQFINIIKRIEYLSLNQTM